MKRAKIISKKRPSERSSYDLFGQFILVFLMIDNYLKRQLIGIYFPYSTNQLPGTFCESKLIPACFIGIAILAKLYQIDISFISRILYLTQENQSAPL